MPAYGPGWGLEIQQQPPERGVAVHDADPPIAVRARVILNNSDEKIIAPAWAMAWAGRSVLVYWRDARLGPFTAWLPANRVRRLNSPVR
jgi:hypothetical protein